MLKIGLTGGLGSGKTAVTQEFSRLGVPAIDTDDISRELTAVNGPALPDIRASFGDSVFNADGTLNRHKLRSKILEDDSARRILESILHPMIQHEVGQRISRLDEAYVLVVIPLLVELGSYDEMLDRVLVVDCSEETQVKRALARGGWTESEIRTMLAKQATRQARLARADDIIHNEGGLDDLSAQVASLNEKYKRMARQVL
ncbi:MAG: dephospho-CoA kinase [Hydrogenophilaceae bacterium]|jgi:dephospho-CoA kinase|nr:dephospho-CoA kinase [Hydrogenophilaceae bacterium]